MTSKPAGAERRFDAETQADRLRLLYDQSVQGVYFSLISAALLAAILWSHTPRPILLGWLITLVFASVARVLLFLNYRRAAPQGREMLRWGRPYMLTLYFSGSTWGVGGVLLIPPDSMLYATIIYFFLMGMAGAGLSAYSAIRSFAIGAVVTVLLPMTAWMLSRGEITPVVMALGTLLFFASALRTSKVLAEMLQQNYLLTHELNESKEAAERLARIDALTGLNNRRAFAELAESSLKFCERQGRPAAAIVLDIDHFKQINDSRGHSVGDQALQHIAAILQASIRKSDICARTGGEEFAVLLPDTDLEAATTVAEKIREAIARQPFPTETGPLLMTASLGVSASETDLECLLGQADQAMYQAKEAGRNRVIQQLGQAPQEDLFGRPEAEDNKTGTGRPQA
jgi:diguanylate cyclase (GGDEF)-like protein